jgi:hypothetical protein
MGQREIPHQFTMKSSPENRPIPVSGYRDSNSHLKFLGERSRRIPVLIEHEAASDVGTSNMQALEERVRATQQSIRRKLKDLGAAESVRVMTLASDVEARLMPAGIRQIAGLPEVKKILWNRAGRVTAWNGAG